jgi:hypothetical protein
MNADRQSVIVALLALAGVAACDSVSAESDELAGDTAADRARPGDQALPTVPVDALFEGNVSYLGLDVAPPKLAPGDRAVVTQYWRLNAALSASARGAFRGWTTYLRAEGPYGRGVVPAQRIASEEAPSLDRWPVGTVIKEEFTMQVPEDWSEPALWLFAGIGADAIDAHPANSLQVVQGPDEDGWRIRALTVRVKRPWSGGLPSWATEARRSELSKLVE